MAAWRTGTLIADCWRRKVGLEIRHRFFSYCLWCDLILTRRGWTVLRFWANEIRDRCGECVARVLRELEAG